jgi:hypothetical protein
MGDEDTWPGANRPPVRILLVDDSDEFCRQAARYLSAASGLKKLLTGLGRAYKLYGLKRKIGFPVSSGCPVPFVYSGS